MQYSAYVHNRLIHNGSYCLQGAREWGFSHFYNFISHSPQIQHNQFIILFTNSPSIYFNPFPQLAMAAENIDGQLLCFISAVCEYIKLI
jgi:hypothetical protein